MSRRDLIKEVTPRGAAICKHDRQLTLCAECASAAEAALAEEKVATTPPVPLLLCSPFNKEEPYTAPKRQYPDDAGFDLSVSRYVVVGPKATVRLPHNLVLAPPPRYYCTIVPRSSTMTRLGLIVLPGLVDPGYRGEVQTVVYNPRTSSIIVNAGERVSQLLLQRQHQVDVQDTTHEELLAERPGSRGVAGFGSTEVRKGKG